MDPFVAAVRDTIKRLVSAAAQVSPCCARSRVDPDSVALLRALKELSRDWPLSLSALHVNHGLRGEESDADASFVEALCRKLEVPLQVRSQPLKVGPGENLQDRARRVRYRFLFAAAAPGGAVVATGHNLQDQAETFLLKLARGSGPTGLAGIFPARDIHPRGAEKVVVRLVRPLLERDRKEIVDLSRTPRAALPGGFQQPESPIRPQLGPASPDSRLAEPSEPGPGSDPGTDRPAVPGGGRVPGRRGTQGLRVVPGDGKEPLRRGHAQGGDAYQSGAGAQEGGGPAFGGDLQGRPPGSGAGARRSGSGPGPGTKRETDSFAGGNRGQPGIRPPETGKVDPAGPVQSPASGSRGGDHSGGGAARGLPPADIPGRRNGSVAASISRLQLDGAKPLGGGPVSESKREETQAALPAASNTQKRPRHPGGGGGRGPAALGGGPSRRPPGPGRSGREGGRADSYIG